VFYEEKEREGGVAVAVHEIMVKRGQTEGGGGEHYLNRMRTLITELSERRARTK